MYLYTDELFPKVDRYLLIIRTEKKKPDLTIVSVLDWFNYRWEYYILIYMLIRPMMI